jgi:hypothetical protein
MMRFACPSCQAVLQAAEGQTAVACPQCKKRVPVPSLVAARRGERTGQDVLQQAGGLARSLGQLATDIVRPQDSDDYARGPAVFLSEEYFGGRTRIGTPTSAMRGILFDVAVALLSWPFLCAFLASTVSAWEFLPFSRTEFVRIQLGQKILWSRLLPVFAIWVICIIVTGVLSAVMTQMAGLIGALVALAGLILSNLAAGYLVKGIAHRLARSRITLDYGFPVKYRLLMGISDAPAEEQIEGVLQLCQALARSEFGPWDQFSAHGGGNGTINAVFRRLTRLLPGG